MPDPFDPVSADKSKLRAAALARRDALTPAERATAAAAVAALVIPVDVSSGAIVSGFSPIRSEIDPGPLMVAMAQRGARLALPVNGGRDKPLTFRLWEKHTALVRGPLGISEPSADTPEVEPDIVLVPLAAFDRAGHRIGYGAGHYDRTLQRLRAMKTITAIGVAFAVQEIARVPATDHDARLDLVVTEREILDMRRS